MSEGGQGERSFSGQVYGSASYGYGQPPLQQPQPYLPHTQSAPLGGAGLNAGAGVYAGVSTISPSIRPQVYGASQPYAGPGAYNGPAGGAPVGGYGSNPSAPPPPSPGVYAQTHPPNAAPLAPNTYPSNPAPPSAPAVPNVFQYQTGGPSIIPPPTSMTPPPNLDPNNPNGPLPGEGAGKMYPPGQAPPQYTNPDYYSHVLSDSATKQSLTHSIVAASGVSGSGAATPNGKLNGGGGGGGGKLNIPGFSGLSISSSGGPGGRPPPSPALQPYHGTYQSISPMPSPLFGPTTTTKPSPLFGASGSINVGKHQASGSFSLGPPAFPSQNLGPHSRPTYPGEGHNQSYNPTVAPGGASPATFPVPAPSAFPAVTPYTPPSPPSHRPSKKPSAPASPQVRPPSRVSSPSPERAYNPAADAKAILEELKHTFTRASPKPLIEILPTLSPSQLKTLRAEYKSIYHGVNLAKHIKSVFTTGTPFGKLIFAVALGPYESEAWFANSWYQKKETRNELLIEALMGKTNKETSRIKASFRDAKYDASLEKAVLDELPANKFRIAMLAQLACTRMEEDETLEPSTIREDVARLGAILERNSAGGGETEMISIIVNRNDVWLREIAAVYRQVYERDLAKAIIRHSKNLVGETLLHILNGAVDKPLRDAKLLDQAINAVVEESREDLLISRATRIHWDAKHLRRVKKVFKKKYGITVGARIVAVTKGSYREFLLRMLRED